MMLMKDETLLWEGEGEAAGVVEMGAGWAVEKARAIAVNWSRMFDTGGNKGCCCSTGMLHASVGTVSSGDIRRRGCWKGLKALKALARARVCVWWLVSTKSSSSSLATTSSSSSSSSDALSWMWSRSDDREWAENAGRCDVLT